MLHELARRGFRIVPEAARAVLREEGGLALRAEDPDGFAAAILECEIVRFAEAEGYQGVVFFDRGLGDLASMPVRSDALRQKIADMVSELRYCNPVFRAPAWRAIYRQDEERTQSWEEAVASDNAVRSAWRGAGYDIVDLPLVTPSERASFILRHL